MREIGTIADEAEARVLADYLLTLGITTKLTPGRAGCGVWVHREDRLDQARGVFADFKADPGNDRYHSARPTAKAIRKEEEKKQADYRKRVRDIGDRWEGGMQGRAPVAFALIAASIAAFVLTTIRPPLFDALTISVVSIDEAGYVEDSGFKEIRQGQIWRLITPIFLHAGLFHLVCNMLAMRYLGEVVEMRKGRWRFGLLIIVAALASNLGEYAKSGGNFCGMSGVVFALAGYLWIKGHTDPGDGLRLGERTLRIMLCWFLLGVFSSLGNADGRGLDLHMANIAHGVGLATGMAFGLLRF